MGVTKQQSNIFEGYTNEELLAIYQTTDRMDVKRELVLRYLYIIKSIAIQMRDVYVSFTQMEDIINEGVLMLMQAIDKYKPEMNAKFETYVSKRIRGMIIDIARKQDWVPRTVRKNIKRMNEASQAFYIREGRYATTSELAVCMEMEEEKVIELMGKANLSSVLSLDMMLEETSEKKKTVQVPSDRIGEQPEESFLEQEFRELLIDAVQMLKEKEQLVISLYYVEELNMKQIASILNVSEPRISQIHAGAIRKLRDYIFEKNGLQPAQTV
jgi:RNA polymerase sigma factor for flagellar operon FliA